MWANPNAAVAKSKKESLSHRIDSHFFEVDFHVPAF
jgi:hypothetical protein